MRVPFELWEYLGKKEIEINTDIEEEVFIDSDGELLTLAWNNLFSNATSRLPCNAGIGLTDRGVSGAGGKGFGEFAGISVSAADYI